MQLAPHGQTRGRGLLPLRLHQVSLQISGQTLLSDISLDFAQGAPSFILGPNGAGKSLLLRICHGLIHPTGGQVQWLGHGAGDMDMRRFAQAMVFQKPVLLRRSVLANVMFPLKLRGVAYAERRARAFAVLSHVGLASLAGRPARVLSGGEQQRLALARAWVLEPQILFLDEPAAALDPNAMRQVEEIIAGIAAGGTKIVMTTHDLGQARRLAGDVTFLHRGRIAERGAAPEFFARPQSESGRAFLNGELTW